MAVSRWTWVSQFLVIFFLHLFQKKTSGDKWHSFLQARCPSCHPTNSVKALEETQNNAPSSGLASSFLHPIHNGRGIAALQSLWHSGHKKTTVQRKDDASYCCAPSTQVDIIWATMTVWRIRGNDYRNCSARCTTVVHNDTHTHTSSS